MATPQPPTETMEQIHTVGDTVLNTVRDAARCSTRLPHYHDIQELHPKAGSHAEWVIKQLMEEYNFTFVTDELSTLKGFLVCEGGDRVISVASDLACDERVFLYFHILGHFALSHVPSSGSTTIYEFRDPTDLPLNVRFQESRADRWAAVFMETLIDDPAAFNSAISNQLKRALSTYTEQNGGWLHATLRRESTVLFERYRLYRWVRTRIHRLKHRTPTEIVCV